MKEDITKAVETMREGGIILYPTETVWGIGCDATNSAAVDKIFKLKQRAAAKSMIVLVDSLAMLERSVDDIPEAAYQLMEAAVEPLTIIYDHPSPRFARNIIAEDGSLAVRVTSDPFCRELCRRFRGPVVSTSANLSGEKPSSSFGKISREIKDGVDYVVDIRHEEKRDVRPSAIIKVSDGNVIKIIR